jgi:hypothetical protein
MLHHKYTIHYLWAILTGSVGLMHGSVHLAGALCTGKFSHSAMGSSSPHPVIIQSCVCRSYLDISRQAGDQEMLGRACVAYADCQHKLGQLDGAVESLETFLQLSHSQVGSLSRCCIGAWQIT